MTPACAPAAGVGAGTLRFRHAVVLGTAQYTMILTEVRPHLTDADLQILPLALSLVVAVLKAHPAALPVAQELLTRALLELVHSSHLQVGAPPRPPPPPCDACGPWLKRSMAWHAGRRRGAFAPSNLQGASMRALLDAFATIVQLAPALLDTLLPALLALSGSSSSGAIVATAKLVRAGPHRLPGIPRCWPD